ncbi:hypothetical protein GT204_33300 [Streptomyces sp. SID4919]|uniref:hypothetical protein n=1 Tax=unclassified Streptomyces TaxID=2593676 RepID=UPI0008239536|nr:MULTISPECIES: hypothetical protein [unclassified Streptomyces]MYY13611.1 hypothetical protein [Streptomyces sp. SID4919]SCK33513.1 hypothetical protein YW7DRAFT_02728 [Streptomyces sp. AmelKG-E11A]
MKIKTGTARALAASVFTAGMLVAVGAPPASAAPSVTFTSRADPLDMGWAEIVMYINGKRAGTGHWAGDPGDWGSSTGDTIIAHDSASDGYGIQVTLDGSRVATTRGHNAPYTDRASGNLPEGSRHDMEVCVVKGSYSACGTVYGVKA